MPATGAVASGSRWSFWPWGLSRLAAVALAAASKTRCLRAEPPVRFEASFGEIARTGPTPSAEADLARPLALADHSTLRCQPSKWHLKRDLPQGGCSRSDFQSWPQVLSTAVGPGRTRRRLNPSALRLTPKPRPETMQRSPKSCCPDSWSHRHCRRRCYRDRQEETSRRPPHHLPGPRKRNVEPPPAKRASSTRDRSSAPAGPGRTPAAPGDWAFRNSAPARSRQTSCDAPSSGLTRRTARSS
mmetsp:Transcript_115337/g.274139  ORF Transcript_115337/g.274139 Transcript_115337/m.274139 type:complete len:243 (-) Transcript_115337:1121-1849(-)